MTGKELEKGSPAPANAAPATRERPAEADEQPWRGNGTVLLVDDEPVVRSVAERMLEHLGFEVLVAENGLQAVEAFERHAHNVRIVLLDMEMPKMNGEEAFLEMSRKRRDVPILISSGYNDEKLTRALLDQGLAGFIQKPYRLASLEQNLRRALNEE